jgi:hypothetical protein
MKKLSLLLAVLLLSGCARNLDTPIKLVSKTTNDYSGRAPYVDLKFEIGDEFVKYYASPAIVTHLVVGKSYYINFEEVKVEP